MATLEELRQKRLQELKGGKSSSGLDDVRAKRIAELRSKQNTFTEKPQEIQDTIDTGTTAGEAFRRTAAVNTLPTVGGIGAGAASGAALGSVAGPIGTVVGFIGGGIAGAILTKKAQDKVLEVTMGEEWKKNLDQSIAEDRKNHPYATLLGEAAPQLIAFKPSPSTLKQALSLSKRALTDTKTLSSHVKTLEGKTELDALINVGVGAGVDVSLETYQQAREGDINALRIIGAAVLGGTISDPNRIGVKLGFNASGDAVIEEYDKFGSKTPAARIVTHGDIPVIDRSVDSLTAQRRELSAILRGEAEANRFTEPRILQAERIAGTIDKDVTPDSDLNVYRLDGRSGAMRIGERVTANPHIADVFGGRINPEATVKAGDLVRTSQGDYVYIPKSAIAEQPKLPPVTAAVEPAVRAEVKAKERSIIRETKAKQAEEARLAEEPARLQREAEALAVKQKAEAERRFVKETKQAEMTKARLESDINKAKLETQKKIAAEKIRIEKERKVIDRDTTKEIETITAQLRKDINDAIIEHTKRLAKAKTKTQKVKEQIRFNNQKANLTSKAIKAKKELRAKAIEAKKKVVDNTRKIKDETNEAVRSLKEKIKTIPKPKLEIKTEAKPKVKAEPAKEPEKAVPVIKEAPEAPKSTTIGTKVVKSESLIKNAVDEAKINSEKAQALDESVTYQMGTTFVEQRKLAADLLAEKGFDDAIKFALEASDADVRKLNLDRSSLYEILYKTAIREGEFTRYHDELEELALMVSDEVSAAAQKSSLHRLATENDPFRRVAKLRQALLQKEKETRGSVFTKEVDELYAKLKAAGSEEDLNKIIKDNLC